MRILLTLCVCCVLGIFGIRAAHADALVADLSEHLVKIDLGFTGKKVLLYGAIEGDGKVVVGPGRASHHSAQSANCRRLGQ